MNVIFEPRIGDEMIRIIIDPYHLKFEFEHSVLEIGSIFEVTTGSNEALLFSPKDKRGNVEYLWSMIGAKITGVDWPEINKSVVIAFDDNRRLKIPSSESGFRGTVYGTGTGSILRCEDF